MLTDRRFTYPLLALVWSAFGVSACADARKRSRRRTTFGMGGR